MGIAPTMGTTRSTETTQNMTGTIERTPGTGTAVTLVIALTAIARPSIAVSSLPPILAQSAPISAPMPSTAQKALPWFWLLLIPLVAGCRWSMVERRSRQSTYPDSMTDDRDLSIEPLVPLTGGEAAVPEQWQTPKARLVADRDRAQIPSPLELNDLTVKLIITYYPVSMLIR